MTKKRRGFLLAAVFAAALLIGYALGASMAEYRFDEIWTRHWSQLPVQPGREVGLTAPGPTWDNPDPPPSRSRSYHAVMSFLRSERYRKCLLPSPMEDGGVVIHLTEGCIPSVVAYWSGGKLWLADENGAWTAYIPSNPNMFKEQMEKLKTNWS